MIVAISMNTLLITPPLMQMNSPYPATAYLTGYLQKRGYKVTQKDLSLDLILKLFSQHGLKQIYSQLKKQKKITHEGTRFFIEAFEDYERTIDSVINFLQNNDPTLAIRISQRTLLPEGPRFLPLSEFSELTNSFGTMGTQDKAKYIASLYLDDIADVIQTSVDPHFYLSRYAESLASSQSSFTPMHDAVLMQNTLIDEMLEEIIIRYVQTENPDLIGFTIPFPGNLYCALKAAQIIKKISPKTKTVIGGGFINTELRELSDPRIFEFIDYIVFDDGELPLELLIKYLSGKVEKTDLIRTLYLENKKIVKAKSTSTNIVFKEEACPTYSGLIFKNYFSMLELPNPMHRLWSDLRWNKMLLAHGCYWKKCSFCDTAVDYIGRYEPGKVTALVDTMESLIKETGSSGFHFVDEAAPPALLKALAQEIINRKLNVSWWGNIRFDSYFTNEVADLLADSGCIAVSGGLEVASPRLLKLINKGVSLEQVSQVTGAFRDAGIYIHAYLMYGFPSQTKKETIDSLEFVRELFKTKKINSAHWHRFVCTTHSPIGKNPEKFGVELTPQPTPKEGLFARYSIPYSESNKCDHEQLGIALKKAVYNYMHGIGINEKVQSWFL